jgi:hypothetical protein
LADSREKLTSNTQYLLCIIQHDLDLCDAEIQSALLALYNISLDFPAVHIKI